MTLEGLRGVRVCMLLFNDFTHDSRVLKQARSLHDAGSHVRILAVEGHGLSQSEVIDGVRIVRVAFDPLLARAIRKLTVLLRRDGTPASAVSLPPPTVDVGEPRKRLLQLELAARRALVGLTYRRWYWAVGRQALAEPVDLVVAHDFETLPVAAYVARRTGARLIYDSHELAAEQRQVVERTRAGRARQVLVERALARRADCVVTVNASLAEELARRLDIRRPVVVRNVPYALDLGVAESHWREDLNLPPHTRIALYLGGLVEHRGLEDLIMAARELDGVAIALMGPPNVQYVKHLKFLAASAGVASRVHFLPPVPSVQVSAFAAAADVGVIPFRRSSLNHWLSLPNKVFEYLAAGLPVVTVAFPELERLISKYDAGRVCRSSDPAALAEAIRATIDSPATVARLRSNASRAARELTWQREERIYLDAVSRTLASPK